MKATMIFHTAAVSDLRAGRTPGTLCAGAKTASPRQLRTTRGIPGHRTGPANPLVWAIHTWELGLIKNRDAIPFAPGSLHPVDTGSPTPWSAEQSIFPADHVNYSEEIANSPSDLHGNQSGAASSSENKLTKLGFQIIPSWRFQVLLCSTP